MTPSVVDNGMVILANAFNLLVVGVFLARANKLRQLEWVLGLVIVLLALPTATAVIANVLAGREWWTCSLPSFLLSYCILEFLLDYVFKSDFRKTDFLYAYLTVFYLAALAMIGYSFGVQKLYGFITLGTYFLSLIAAWYSYTKVGHG
jgi:cell division protein FtsW (lipid II flippase)